MKRSLAKIWFIIIILAITFWALIQWGAKSFQNSSESIQSIVRPDSKSSITNEIFQSIIQTDLHLNHFILTNKKEEKILAEQHKAKTDSLIHELDFLLGESSLHSAQLDSLRQRVAEKSDIYKTLIAIKTRQNSHFFTEQALNKIKNQISDSAFIETAITQKEDLIIHRDTVEQTEIVRIPDSYKGFAGFFRKIRGKEKVTFDTITTQQEQLNYNIELTENSQIVRDYFIDTTLSAVKDILIEVLDDEIQVQRKLYSTELSILSYNQLLLQNIRILLDEIASTNSSNLRREQEQAIQQLESSNKEAFIIAGAGILLGLILLIFLIKDISQTHIYRKKLEEEKERAEQLAQAKEIFLSRMSHEIRTPLHSIAGFSNLLNKEIHGATSNKYLQGILQANFYLQQLINNILEQAKINSGSYQLDNSNVYIPALSQELLLLFQHQQQNQHLNFNIAYSPEFENITIQIDAIKLRQILLNLISNAFKFTTEGRIAVQWSFIDQRTVQIQITDTGIGIDAQNQEIIFQPFHQINTQHVTNINGSGLGLSITKQIIESFGGEIKLKSSPGKGSEFTILLPVKTAPYTANNITEQITESENVWYPIRILAVEDDEWNGYLLQNYLKDHIQQLVIFNNAEDGWQALKNEGSAFDLILTDLNLPQMDGKSFFRKVKSQFTTQVIALSASLSKKEAEELIESGFTNTLGKPFTQKDILQAIDEIFASQKTFKKSNSSSSFDWKQLMALNHANDDEILQVCRSFTESFESKIVVLKAATEKKDFSEMARMAHQLKSGCEQIGITHLSERLQSVEVFEKMGNHSRTIEEVQKLIPELDAILIQLHSEIAGLT